MNALLEKQFAVTRALVKQLAYAHARGYDVTLGDAYRDPRVHGAFGIKAGYGAPHSNHKLRLAIDLNVFRGGVLLVRGEDYRDLGDHWEILGGAWGGRFGDGNHFSFEHNGRK